jgi:protein-tyrosine kinase
MNIVERAAELLGPIERPSIKFRGPIDIGTIHRAFDERTEPGLPEPTELAGKLEAIERAIGESRGQSRFAETPERSAQLQADSLVSAVESISTAGPYHPKGQPSRTLSIDTDQLRRQSLITPDGERTPNAESFRRIKRQVLANVATSKADVPANLVVVTSALAGEGKTFCAVNLAISIALEMDHTVLLVEADVARPSLSRMLGLKSGQGLMDVLLDRRIALADVLWKTDLGKLTLLPVGTAHHHATELLASDAMRSLLREMAERYHDRIIIFDSPPLLAASEAQALASQMGQVVMVVEAGKTTEAALKAALGHLQLSKVTGLLLNKGHGPGPGYYYRNDG